MKSSSVLIGNMRSREVHRQTCPWVRFMNQENMIRFRSFKEALNQGFDSCGHCLRNAGKPEAAAKSPGPWQYDGFFCLVLDNAEYCNHGDGNITAELPRKPILLRAKVFSHQNQAPVPNCQVRFSHFPDDIDEETISSVQTDEHGVADCPFDPHNLAQGVTRFRASFPAGTCFDGNAHGDHLDMLIDFLPAIQNIRVEPKSFPRTATIFFDVSENTVLDISIYRSFAKAPKRTNFTAPFAHRKTIRSYADGPLGPGENLHVQWDGTNDRNRQTWRGKYVVVCKTPKDFVVGHDFLVKTKGKLGG